MVQYELVLTVGGYVYGCLTGQGSKGEEEKGKGEEVGGPLPPTAILLSLRVRHCSVSHQNRTCSHTRTIKRTQRAHTLVQSECEAMFLFKEFLVLPPRSLVTLVSSCFFLSPSVCQVSTHLLVSSLKDKREGGRWEEDNESREWEGQRGAMCQDGRKITLCHVFRPLDRPRHGVKTPIKS